MPLLMFNIFLSLQLADHCTSLSGKLGGFVKQVSPIRLFRFFTHSCVNHKGLLLECVFFLSEMFQLSEGESMGFSSQSFLN